MILRILRKLLGPLALHLLLALLMLTGMPGRAAALAETRVGDFFAEPLNSRLVDAPHNLVPQRAPPLLLSMIAPGSTVAPNNAARSIICFAAGTKVSTPSGARNIEEIKEGESIFAFDFETQGVVERQVLATIRNFTYFWMDVQIGSEIIHATRGHQFWVESEQQWIEAANLKPGMSVRLHDRQIAEITNAIVRELQHPETTYNLIVEQEHNYFAGNAGVLVHNGHGDWPTSDWWQTSPHTVYQGSDGYIGLTDDFSRRQAEWAAEGRRITPLHENIPGRLAGRGVEQIEIDAARTNGTGVKQYNSIAPGRTDPKALEMRARGQQFLQGKNGC